MRLYRYIQQHNGLNGPKNVYRSDEFKNNCPFHIIITLIWCVRSLFSKLYSAIINQIVHWEENGEGALKITLNWP